MCNWLEPPFRGLQQTTSLLVVLIDIPAVGCDNCSLTKYISSDKWYYFESGIVSMIAAT
jgi:hypothetical protein